MYDHIRIQGTKENFNSLAMLVRGAGVTITMVNPRSHLLQADNLPRELGQRLHDMGATLTDLHGQTITPRANARIGR